MVRSRIKSAQRRSGGVLAGDLNRRAEHPASEGVAELAVRIVLGDQLQEALIVRFVQSSEIVPVESLGVLAEMRSAADTLDQLHRGGVVGLETLGVVADQVDPGAAALLASADQRAVVPGRGEADLEQQIGQPGPVQLGVERE